MGIANVTYTRNGVLVQYNVPFPFLSRSHVVVKVNGLSVTPTWISDGIIQMPDAGMAGDVILIQRITPSAGMLSTFSAGTIGLRRLNDSLRQLLYVLQEAMDSAADALMYNVFGDFFSANGKEIRNLANGTASTSAITKAQLDGVLVAAGNVPAPGVSFALKSLRATAVDAFNWQEGPIETPVYTTSNGLSGSGSTLTITESPSVSSIPLGQTVTVVMNYTPTGQITSMSWRGVSATVLTANQASSRSVQQGDTVTFRYGSTGWRITSVVSNGGILRAGGRFDGTLQVQLAGWSDSGLGNNTGFSSPSANSLLAHAGAANGVAEWNSTGYNVTVVGVGFVREDPNNTVPGVGLSSSGTLWSTSTIASASAILHKTNAAFPNTLVSFRHGTASISGSITQPTATTVAYNTTSDRRFKEDIQQVEAGIAIQKLLRVKPRRFRWKHDRLFAWGFIADEFQDVFPMSVTGQPDATNEDGSADPQAIDAGTPEVIATVFSVLQHLHSENQTLTLRLADMERRVSALS